jgi:predicted Zn-dependent peptidase
MHRTACVTVALLIALGSPAARATPAVEIPYERFTLDNGLTVLVHEDRKAPIVAVNVWYHVGSKNEKPGRTGFAHLFEHLMFQGSEHSKDEYIRTLESLGATNLNGTTNLDRTNYFQNVPKTALDAALWLESDRMGHLLGVIDQARLDEQRGVVKNEKRQGENQPYGRVFENVLAASFPPGHPYRWPVIGYMEDLDAATLDDVHAWFRSYYGATNAVLVLAGDIDVATAKEKAQKYFGHIASGPPLTRHERWIAPRTESTRGTMHDRIAQTRVLRTWNAPEAGSEEAELLAIAAHLLGGGKSSRLYERLVYRDRLADAAGASLSAFEIAGIFGVQIDVKEGIDPGAAERAFEEDLRRFIAKGPTAAELERARTTLRAAFVRGLERIGGFGGKADVLAQCQVFLRDPGCYATKLRVLAEATPQQIRAAAQRWLSAGDYTLAIHPQDRATRTAASAVDRSAGVPKVEQFPDLAFPTVERRELANGVPVLLARRAGVPLVQVSFVFDAGFAADPAERSGLSSFALGMLDEGTERYSALALANRLEALGAGLILDPSLDHSTVGIAALSDKLAPSLELLSEVIRRPTFPANELERVRNEWLAGIEREKKSPRSLPARLLPPLLYGAGHPYAIPFTGSGASESIAALQRADLQRFQRTWLHPQRATIIVVGDTTADAVLPLLEKTFGDWRSDEPASPKTAAAPVAASVANRVFLVDQPGAIQSTIVVGQLMPASSAAEHLELQTMDDVLAGMFSSRINMNLRESKHWSYGARSSFGDAVGPRPWIVTAPVQSDRTVESMQEIRREIAEFAGSRPATATEIGLARDNAVRALAGRYETNASVASALRELLVLGRPDDYVVQLKSRLEAQREDDVRRAAAQALRPGGLTWIVIGDLGTIEAPIRALGLGETRVIDAGGKILR